MSLLNSFLGVLFPLITFPYITRVLSPEGMGQFQFYFSIIEYVILFTSVGIPLYGVREIAKNRDNALQRNNVLIELLLLHLVFSIIGYVIVGALSILVVDIQQNRSLFYLLSLGIFFNTIGVNWFYQGIEDFRYITIRSFFVKIVSVTLLFTLVKDKNDLFYYGVVQLLGTGGNYLFNFFYLRKFAVNKNRHLFTYKPLRHLKPTLKVFLLNVTTGVYTQISFLLLGFLQDNTSVGFYSIPYRILAISLTVITSLGSVLLPRLSNYIATDKFDKFISLGNRAISFILALVLPMSVGLILLAEPIIIIVSGNEFIPSIPVLKILSLNIILIGLSQIYGKYMLYPLGKEITMAKCTGLGLLVYIAIGIPSIIFYAECGAAFATFCAEMSVTLSMIVACRKLVPCKLFTKKNLTYVLATLFMSLSVYLCTKIPYNIMQIIVGMCVGVFMYFVALAIGKDSFFTEIIMMLKSRKNVIK